MTSYVYIVNEYISVHDGYGIIVKNIIGCFKDYENAKRVYNEHRCGNKSYIATEYKPG